MWTLGALEERLSEYIFEIYDTVVHPALSLSPRDAFTAGLESSGLRLQRMIGYDEDFLMATLPTTAKGVAKVFPGRGVKVNRSTIGRIAFGTRRSKALAWRCATILSTPAPRTLSWNGNGCAAARSTT